DAASATPRIERVTVNPRALLARRCSGAARFSLVTAIPWLADREADRNERNIADRDPGVVTALSSGSREGEKANGPGSVRSGPASVRAGQRRREASLAGAPRADAEPVVAQLVLPVLAVELPLEVLVIDDDRLLARAAGDAAGLERLGAHLVR